MIIIIIICFFKYYYHHRHSRQQQEQHEPCGRTWHGWTVRVVRGEMVVAKGRKKC